MLVRSGTGEACHSASEVAEKIDSAPEEERPQRVDRCPHEEALDARRQCVAEDVERGDLLAVQ